MRGSLTPLKAFDLQLVSTAASGLVAGGLGGIYVAHVLKGARETYGTFATVIGLMPGCTSAPASSSTRPSSTRC